MKSIMVPCDFSETAQEAYKFAVQLAQQSGAELHVLFVIDITFVGGSPALSHTYAFNVDFLRKMERESEENFQRMWEKLSPITLAAKFRHRVGVLAEETRRYIEENNIDLVVMGTSGTGGAKWGSNVEKIVRASPVPVFAIRTAPVNEIHDIVVPVSVSRDSAAFMERIKALQQFFHATLHLLYINTPILFQPDRTIRRALDDYAKRAGLTECVLHIRADKTVQEGIAQFMKEKRYDMVAMGTHGWKGLAHAIFGSIAEDVVNDLQVPVWTCALN